MAIDSIIILHKNGNRERIPVDRIRRFSCAEDIGDNFVKTIFIGFQSGEMIDLDEKS